MIGESKTERYESQSRIDRARGRIHRRSADVQIRESVHLAVRIDDPLLRIRAHARRPHVMPSAADEARPRLVVAEQPVADLHATGVGASHLAAEYMVEGAHRMLVEISHLPIEPRARHAERVLLGAE